MNSNLWEGLKPSSTVKEKNGFLGNWEALPMQGRGDMVVKAECQWCKVTYLVELASDFGRG